MKPHITKRLVLPTQLLQYQNLMTALLLTFVVVMMVDYLSARIRSFLIPSIGRPAARAPLLSGLTTLLPLSPR